MSFVQIVTVQTNANNQMGLAQMLGLEIRNQVSILPGFVSASIFKNENQKTLVATFHWDDAIEPASLSFSTLLPPNTSFVSEAFHLVDHLSANDAIKNKDDLVDEQGRESFPASDPPAY